VDQGVCEIAERGNAQERLEQVCGGEPSQKSGSKVEFDDVLSQLNILQTVVFSVITKHTQCFK